MRPLLKSGDVAFIQPCSPDKIKAGDMVAYRDNGRVFLHRLWGKRKASFIIGDDGGVIDVHTIESSQIVGKAIHGPNGLPGLIWGKFFNILFKSLRKVGRIPAIATLLSYLRKQVSRFNWNNNKSFIIKSLKWIPAFQTVSQVPKAVIASDRRERGNLNLLSKGEIASVALLPRKDVKNELRHSLFAGMTGLRTLLQIRRCTQLPLRNHLKPILRWLFLSSLVFLSVHPALHAVTRQKTVEWSFGICPSTAVATATKYTMPVINFRLPDAVTVKNAWLEFDSFSENVNDITAIDLFFDQGAAANTIRDAFTGATLAYNTGESLRFHLKCNIPTAVFANVTANNNYAAAFRLTATSGNFGQNAMKLYVTYEYDDTAPVQVNTVHFPIKSNWSSSIASALSSVAPGALSFTYNAEIAESGYANFLVKQQWFEVRGHRLSMNAATDGTIVSRIGTNAYAPSMTLDGSLIDSYDFFYLSSSSTQAGFSVNSQQTLNIETTQNTVYNLGGECVVTYECAGSAVVKTKTVNYLVGQSATGAAASFPNVNLNLEEGGVNFKALYARILGSYNGTSAGNVTWNYAVNGVAGNQVYTHNTQAAQTGVHPYFLDLWSTSPNTTWYNGSPVSLSYTPSVAANTGAIGAELTATYQYTEALKFTDSSKIFAYQSGNGVIISTTLAFPTFTPIIENPEGRKALASDYLSETFLDQRNGNTITANPTLTLNINSSAQSITAQPATGTEAILFSAIYTDPLHLLTTNNVTLNANADISVNNVLANGIACITYSYFPPPNSPNYLNQYEADAATFITTGTWVSDTTAVLKMNMTSRISDTLTPVIEALPLSTSFTGTNVSTGSSVAFSSTTAGATGTITVTGLTNGTTYHWRARVFSANGISNWVSFGGNPETSIDFGVDLSSPTMALNAPLNQSATNQAAVNFQWTGTELPATYNSGVNFYAMQVSTDPGFGSIAYSSITARTSVSATLSQATYYWCVSATDNAENIGDPASYSFVLDTTAPSAPSLSQPLDTGATNQLAVNFQWNPSDDSGFRGNAGINGYDISISTDANFTVYSSSGYSTGASLSRTVPRQNYYYWKVRAKDNAQNYGFWSSTWAVRVDTTAPPTPTLATPLADFATNYATVPFTWNTVSDTSTGNSGTGNYELYIATVPGFAPLLYSTQTLSTSFAYTCTQETTYYWQVRAYDLAGNASGWAASRYLQYDVTVSTVQRNTPPDSQQTPPRFHSGAAPVISFTYTDTISRLNELKYSITSQPDGGGTTFVPWTLVTSSPVAVSSYTATISPSWASLTEWATNYVHLYYSDRAGNYGIWNNAFDILKDTTAPPVPALTKPIDVFKTNLSSVTFSWSTTDLRSGTSYYILQVSTMANFVPVKASSQTALSNASLTGFTTNYYYWNTMACDLAGNSTVYSSTRAFVVDIATPTMIVRAPLINGDTTWRSVNNFSYNVDFYDTGGSLLDHFDISVSTGKNRAAPFLADWTDSGVNIVSSSTYTGDWHFSDTIWQNLMTNTTNYVSLRVYDLAGNCSTYLDAFFIKKSTSNVQIINSETGQDTVWRSTSTSRLYNVQFTNSGGDIAGVQYCAYSGQNFAGTQRFNWTPIPVISASLPTPSTGNWQIGPTEFQTLADGGTSYISVRCWEAGGSTVTAQDVFFVKKDTTQPSLQSLSGPLNGAATGQQAVNFSWQAATDLASGTTQYYIQVATSTTFVPVTYSSYTSAVSLQSSALTQSTYYWEIKAKDLAGNWSVYSASWTVQVDTTPPPVPSPTGFALTGFTTNYFTQTFQWSSVTDAGPAGLSVYSFTLSTSATMSPNYSSITVNTSSTTTLSLSSTYYWNVAAVDRAQNYSNASATQSIIIDGLAPPAPSLATPNDQFASNIQSVTFNWTGADNGPSGIMQYQLQVSTDINFGVFYTTTTSLLSNTTNFQQNTLWWKVKSFDYAGNFSAFSATKTFVVDISSPPAPGNATPSNDTRANSLSRGFTWGSVTDNGPAGIQGYELAVSTDPYFGIIAYSSATALPPASLTFTSQNIFYWKTRAQDEAGNYSLYSSTFSLTVDSTTPGIVINQTGADAWQTDASAPYDVQFFDTPDTAGAGLSAAQYRIYSSSTPTTGAPAGTQLVTYQNIFTPKALPDRTSYYILPWSISGAAFSALNQGRNFVFVKSSDMAGNTTEPSSYAFYIMKDTAAPSVTNGDPVPAWESDDETHSTLITDAGAGVVVASYTACSLPNRSAGPTIPWTTVCDVPATASWNTPWNLNFTLLAPGTNYISIKTADAKGNLSISTDTFIVLKDTIPPNAVANLSVSTGTASGSLTLKWTTPADDTLTDPSNTKLTSYLVKYNAAAFASTADFLANGTTFFNSWTPKTPGLADQQDVTGLVEGTTYFVGIAGIDKAGNAPALLSGSTNYGYAARIAPSKITDLVGTSIPDALDPGAVELTWTAVGDDSKTGTAAGYLVKYATFAFTSSQWNASNVTTFSQAWPPSSANAPEDRVAAGLTPGVTYYLAIEAYDAASPGANYSVMSNTVCVQAKPTGPADGMLCYGAGILPNPQYYKITATGAGWTSAPGANNAAATIYWSVVQACPVIRNEKLLATLSSTGDIYTQRWGWDGVAQSWGTPVLQTTIASADAIYRPVDIAYEQTTGRAIVAWRGAAGQANYRIWSSTANAWLTSETALTMGGSGLVRWLRLEPRPGTDEIMLVTLDANNAMFAYRWNGSAWVNNTQLTVAAYISTYQSFDLAWENTNGSCLILWGEGAQTKYAQWSSQSSAWVALGSNGPQIAAGAGAYWIRLNADRASGSNNIAMSSLDSGKDWNVSVWDGAGWAAPTELSASLTLATPRMMDIAWEKDTGKCLTVGALSTQTQYVSYATWASGVWSGVTTYSGYSLGNGAALRMLQLTPGPNSNKMILMGSNAGAAGAVYLRTLQWTGSGWSNTQGSLISNGSTNAYEFFAVSLDRFDNQSPTCTPYQNGDDTWRAANTGTYDVDFFDTGGSHLAKVQSQLKDESKVTYRGWTDELTGLNTDSYTALWPLTTATWNQLHRGRSYISLRVFDGLGNYTDSVDAFYVQKDTEPPAISSILPVSTTWYATTTAPVVIATATFADQSGLSLLSTAQYLVYPQPNMGGAKICQGTIFNPPGVASEPSFGFALNAGDWSLLVSTISYVSLRCDDIVGNSTTFIDAFTVLRDTIPPSIPATPQPLDASATSQLTIAFQWNASTDTGPNGSSGINGYALVISTDINFSVISSSGYSSTPSLSRALPVQSTYYWHVQAKDNAQNYSAWSSTWTILVDTAAPPAPALATPLTDFATNYATVNFTWNTVSDTSTGNSGIGAYELYIASVPGFAPLLTSTRTLATSFTYTFAQETTCYWQVRAIDNVNNTSGWAASRYLEYDATPPAYQRNILPDSQQTPPAFRNADPGNYIDIDFSDALSRLNELKLTVTSQPDGGGTAIIPWTVIGSSPVAVSSYTANFGVTWASLQEGVTNYVHLYYSDRAGNSGTYNNAFDILKDTTPPSTPSPLTPADQVTVNTPAIAFDWTDAVDLCSGTSYYTLQIATSTTFVPVTAASQAAVSQAAIANIAENTYYWRTWATDRAGNLSLYSSTRTFLVDLSTPTMVIGAPLLNGDTTWRSVNIFTYNVDFNDGGGSLLDHFDISVSTTKGRTPPLLADWTNSGVNIVSSSTYTGDWHFPDAVWQNLQVNTSNYISLRVYDLAGNCSTYLDAFFVKQASNSVQIINSEAGQDTVWRSTSTARRYNVEFTNSAGDINDIQYCAYNGQNLSGTRWFDWTDIPVIYASLPAPSTGNWQIGPSEFISLGDSGINYISVRCWQTGGDTITARDVFYVKKDTTVPSIQALSGPLNGAATGQQTVNFSWQAATDLGSGTTQYYIQIATSSAFIPVTYSSYTSAVSLQSSALPQATYYWEIKAKDLAGNWSVYSASWTVQVDTTPPPAPNAVSPLTGFTTNYAAQTFQWSQVTDAGPAGLAAYSLILSTSATLTPVNYSSVTVNTSVTTSLALSSTYYWSVAAIDRAQNPSAGSTTQSIIVDTMVPATPSLSAPADAFAANIQTVAFTWSGADNGPSGILQYQLQVSTDINFGVFYSTLMPLLSHTTTFQEGTYWWKVKSFDNAGNVSQFASTRTFCVDLSSPPAPSNSAPGNDSRKNTLSPAFSWSLVTDNGPAGTMGYALAVSTDPYFGVVSYSSSTVSTSASLTFTAQNIFFWKARAQDRAGNYSLYSSTFSLTIDTTTPAIVNNQAGDDTWRAANAGSYAVQFFDTPDSGGAGLSAAQYRIYSSSTPATGAPAGTQLAAYQNIFATLPDRTSYYTLPWSISGTAFSALNQGYNFVFVKSSDMAGNTTEPTAYAFYVKKDTVAPSVTNGDTVSAWESTDGTHSTLITDAGAGVVVASYTACSLPNRSGGQTIPWTTVCDVSATASWNTPWSLNFTLLAPGTNYISIKTADALGNVTISTDTFIVLKDTIPPNAVANLSVSTGTASGSLTLKWTTPADDSFTDISSTKVASYLVKYKATAFASTADFLANGTTFFNSWTPKTPGLADQQDVAGLVEGTTYFVGLAGIDKAGNAPSLVSGSTNYSYALRVAPANITDLAGTSAPDTLDPGSVELSWTAVGNDGTSGGAATGYTLKYATFAFTSAQWNASNVTTFSQAWTPAAPTTHEDQIVAGLTANATYYFAIKAYDSASPGADYSTMSSTISVMSKPTGPADGMLCYGAGTFAYPCYYKTTAAGSSWTGIFTASNTVATIYWSVLRACPVVRNEKLLATLSSTGDIYTQRWDGQAGAGAWDTPVLQTTITAGDAIYRPIDIAYEQTSGRAIVAARGGAAGQVTYRIWSSTASAWLNSATTLTMGGSGFVRWLRLEPRPGTNEIMLVTMDANKAMFAYRWDGSSWVNNTQLTLAPYTATYQCFDLAWENTRGNNVILWAESTSTKYAMWSSTASAWVAVGSAGPNIAATAGANWIKLAGDTASGSNKIAMAALDTGPHWNVSVWDGTTWANPNELSTAMSAATSRMIDIAWEKDTGKCMAVGVITSPNSQYVSYSEWSAGAWPAITTYSNFNLGNSVALKWLQLTPDPNSNKMALIGENSAAAGSVYLRPLQWTGAAWINPQTNLVTNGTNNAYEFFMTALNRYDTVSPSCNPYQQGDDTWRSSNNGSYDVDFLDTGGSHVSKVQSQLEDSQKVMYRDWMDELTGLNSDNYTSLWPLSANTWNQLRRGKSYMSLRTFDGVGNSIDTADAFYVLKDTEPPAISSILPVSTTWYTSAAAPNTVAGATFTDQSALSLLSTAQYLIYPQTNMGGTQICQGTIFNPPGNASQSLSFGLNSGHWDLLANTSNYVTLRCYDLAGNTTIFVDAFTIMKDTIPPQAITTLQSAPGPFRATINLSWLAPGDNGSSGSNSEGLYVIKFATFAITDINLFNGASTYAQSMTPQQPKAQESITILNLDAGTTWYFSVRAMDKAHLWPGISNSTGTLPRTDNVYINEVYAAGAGSTDWVELYNSMPGAQSLAGWTLVYNQGSIDSPGSESPSPIWTGSGSLSSKQFLVIPSLNLNGDASWHVKLKDDQNRVVDTVQWPVAVSGKSFSRISDGNSYFEIDPTLTQGYANSLTTGTIKINEIDYASAQQFVEIYNVGADTPVLANWYLRNSNANPFKFTRKIYPNTFSGADFYSIDNTAKLWTTCFGGSGLNATADYVVLENDSGQAIDRVTWKPDAGDNAVYYTYKSTPAVFGASALGGLSSPKTIGRKPSEGWDTFNNGSDFALCTGASYGSRNNGSPAAANTLSYPQSSSYLPRRFPLNLTLGANSAGGANNVLWFVRTGGSDDTKSPHIYRLSDIGFNLASLASQTTVQSGLAMIDIDGNPLVDAAAYKLIFNSDTGSNSAPQITAANVTFDATVQDAHAMAILHPWLNDDAKDGVLRIDIINRSPSSANAIELSSVTVKFTDGSGTALNTAKAQALFNSISLVVDNQSYGTIGAYQSDIDSVTIAQVNSAAFNLDGSGAQILGVSNPNGADSRVVAASTRTYFVAVTLTGSASGANPNTFKAKIIPGADTFVRDGPTDIDQAVLQGSQVMTSSPTIIVPAAPPAGTSYPAPVAPAGTQITANIQLNTGVAGAAYAGASDGKLYAINSDGTGKWSFDAGSPISRTFSSFEAGVSTCIYLATDAGMLYKVQDNGNAAAQQWSGPRDLHSAITSDIMDNGGCMYAGTANGNFYKINPANGADADPTHWVSNPGISGAINGAPVIASPNDCVSVNAVWFGTSNGTFYRLDNENGTVSISTATSTSIRTSPYISLGFTNASRNHSYIYFGDDDGYFRCRTSINLKTKPDDWTDLHVSSPIFGSPVSNYMDDNDRGIYFGADNGVFYKVDYSSGGVYWTFQTRGPIRTMPMPGNGTDIYFGSDDGCFYGINTVTGQPLSNNKFPIVTGGEVRGSPAYDATTTPNRIYFGSNDGKMYCVEVSP